ncbi:MTRF1L release factor glutamine methyltransferase isoform 1-T1 [Synchiropus picturatus]
MLRRLSATGTSCFLYTKPESFQTGWSCFVRTCSTPAFPSAPITALQAVDLWRRHFEQSGVTEPGHSSRYILAHLLGAKTMGCLDQKKLSHFLTQEETERMWTLCSRRLSRMPVQYVIEEWDFRDMTLKMRPPVFIPRPETEELVELVLTDFLKERDSGPKVCLEVGCGSGAISLSLLKKLPELTAVALDQSRDAVDLTRENALKLSLQDRLQLHHLDVIEDADAVLRVCGRVSAVVSNPPYLYSEEMAALDPEILRFEDPAALDGGADGLSVIRQILTLAPRVLCERGRVYLEVNPRHLGLVQQWAEENPAELSYMETRHDISGRPRFCILQKEESKDQEMDLD